MSKSALHTALLEFEQSVSVLPRSEQAYGYKYCPLPEMMDIISPLLHKLDLVIHQSIEDIGGQWVMRTTIEHSSGETKVSTVPMMVKPAFNSLGHCVTGPQEMGAAITYSRRYGIATALNLVADEDTDTQVKRISRKELGQLINALEGIPGRESKVLSILNHYEIVGLENLPASEFAKILNWLVRLKEEAHKEQVEEGFLPPIEN